MRMPSSKTGGARFRGPTSSEEYNGNEDQKYLELIELYKQSSENLVTLKEAHQVVLLENETLNNYVKMLEDAVAQLEVAVEGFSNSSYINGRFSKTGFVQNMTLQYPQAYQDQQVLTPRCEVDLQHRFTTIPKIHQIPKTHVVDEKGNHIIPSELKVKIGRTSIKGTVSENELLNAFNGDNLSYWKRNVTYDNPSDVPANGEDVIIEVELPIHLVNNLNVNTIAVHPHPERGIEIQNIEIHYNNSWQTITGFKQNEITSIQSNDFSPRRKWFFPNVPIQKIRITLVQHHPVVIGGKTIFTLGAQEIGAFLTMFEPSGGMVLTPFDMDGIYNIESVEHVFLNRSAFSYAANMEFALDGKIFEYELYTEEPDGTLRPLASSDWSSQMSKRIWVKSHLFPDPHNGVNPCLHAVRLHYTKV